MSFCRHPSAPQRVGRSAPLTPKAARCSPHVSHIVCTRLTMSVLPAPLRAAARRPLGALNPKGGSVLAARLAHRVPEVDHVLLPAPLLAAARRLVGARVPKVGIMRAVVLPARRSGTCCRSSRQPAACSRCASRPWSGTCRRRGPWCAWAAAAGASGRAARGHHRHQSRSTRTPPLPCAHALRPTVPKVIARPPLGPAFAHDALLLLLLLLHALLHQRTHDQGCGTACPSPREEGATPAS